LAFGVEGDRVYTLAVIQAAESEFYCLYAVADDSLCIGIREEEFSSTLFPYCACHCMVITCLQNLKISGNFKGVREKL